MAQRFEHCRLANNQIVYLGRAGMLEDKKDSAGNEFKAWDQLEKDGWELVSVVANKEGHIAYFKRPVGK